MSKVGAQHSSRMVTASVRLPPNATPGQIFHCTIRGRCFEVLVPENAVPGTLIHVEFQSCPQEGIEYSKSGARIFTTVDGLYEATLEKVQEIDDAFRIRERTESFVAPVVTRVQKFDEKVHIGSRVNGIWNSGASKVTALDNKLKVSMRFWVAGEWVVGVFREVDRRLGLSNTSAKLVLFTANTASAVFTKLVAINSQHHILENVGGVVTAATRPFTRKPKAIEAPPANPPPVSVKELPAMPDAAYSAATGKKVYLKK